MVDDGKRKRLETVLEVAVILAFFTAILFLGPATASEHKIRHEYPVGYAASDSYQHQSRAEAIKKMGQYKTEAPYMMAGLTDVTGFYPPVLYHVTVLFSHLAGLETYDALFFIVGFCMALAALVAYFLTKNIGKSAALLALPLTLFIATGKPFLGAATFGQMPVVVSGLFLMAAAWAIAKAKLPRIYLLIAVFVAGTIMTHTSEALFFAIMMVLIFTVVIASKVLEGKLSALRTILSENKNLFLAVAIAAVLTAYFLPLFMGVWMKIQPYKFKVEKISESFPAATVFLSDFGFMFLLILAGLIAAVLLAVQKRKELGTLLQSPSLFVLAYSLFMLLAGFGTYAGFGLRSFQTRLLWPIYLAPLAGFGAYQILRFLLALVGKRISPVVAAVIITALLSTAVVARYYSPPSTGSMNPFHWEAMRWIAENTPKDAKIYVLYSQVYGQTSVLYNTERVNYFLELDNYNKIINGLGQNDSFERVQYVTVTADSGAGLPYRKGLLGFGRHTDAFTGGPHDICDADYYLIDIAFGENQKALGQVNYALLQKLLKANATVEYQNQWLTVLKNLNVGGDCIA